MAYKIFLDTNILLDFFSEDRANSKEAQELFLHISNSSFQVCLSESVLTTFDYLMAKSLSKTVRAKILLDICSIMTILACNNDAAILAAKNNFPDYEDALLFEIAAKNEVDYIVTNDKLAIKSLGNESTKVISTKGFLKVIQQL